MNATFKMHKYDIFIQSRNIDNADIKCFTEITDMVTVRVIKFYDRAIMSNRKHGMK